MKKTMIFLLIALFSIVHLNAWDGYSYEKGSYIDVDSYDHQGQGEGDVEYYDYSDGQYHTGYLDMESGGTGQITDEDGNTFEVDMD